MYFNPPQNDKTSPFFHPLNKVNEEVKTIDKKKAKDIYDKLKKGSEIEVDFGNSFTRGGTPITLKVTSGHRVVGASRVGRIILVNTENPRGVKYKLFDRNGSVSLAQGDMGTILRDMKIVKEGVEELDESRDDFDYLDIEAAMQDAKLEAPKVVKTRRGYQVMVFSRKLKKHIPQGPPHRSKAAAEKDAKMFEDVQLDEAKAEFQFSDKATAQKFMREVSQARQGSSTGTSDGKVTTDFTDLGNLELKSVAKIMKKYGGKLIKTSERQMAKVFEEYAELEEERGSKIQVMVKGDRNAYERLTRAITMGKVPGYEGAMFKGKMTTLTFDAKKHTGAVRRKLAKMIKDSGGEFDRSIEEQVEILDETVKIMFKGFGREATEFQTKLKKFGFDKEYRKMMQDFQKNAKSGDGFYVTTSDRGIGFEIHPVSDMMMGNKIKKLGDKQDLGMRGEAQLIAIKEGFRLDEKEFKAHKMYHPTTGEEVDAKTREDHLKFKAMGYLHDKPDMEEGFASDAQRRAAFASGYKAKGKKK
jgi:hypothetical protein